MLSQLQSLISSKKRRWRRETATTSARTRHFERLESRSLLSVSLGMVQFEGADYGRSANSLVEPPHWNEGMYAPPPQMTAFGSSAMSHPFGLQHDDSYGYEAPTSYKNVGDGPGAWSGGGPGGSSQSNLSTARISSASKPVSSISVPTQTIFIIVLSNSPVSFGNFTVGSPSATQQSGQPKPSLPLTATASSTKTPGDHAANYLKDFLGVAAAEKGPNAASAAVPTATQLLARSSDRAVFLPSAAVDAAIQSYSPGLLLATTKAGYDRATTTSADNSTGPCNQSLDDLIELDSSTARLAGDESSESAVSGTDNIDALLSRLQDVDSLSYDAGQVRSASLVKGLDATAVDDMPMPLAVMNIALANAEGGMAMIEVGDARANEIDFSIVADDVAMQSHVHVAGEAAVGFYQAMDIGGEEIHASLRSAASPNTQAVKETRAVGRYSAEERGGKHHKAAAAVGATALVGAMVWCARRKQTDDETTAREVSVHARRVN